ncbi:hypothetical protein PG996_013946 [Apiospora saccharicola]|uniref:Uncharacterized protein n=1 Tax=Apiospora saccharicola TaxID=335842 RepID=A0ABR1TH13_9PEZI
MRPFNLSPAPRGRELSQGIKINDGGRRPNGSNNPKPKPSLRQAREEWFQRAEQRCAYCLRQLAIYESKLDELRATKPSAIPRAVWRNRTYPKWWTQAANARGEVVKKIEHRWLRFEEFREEQTLMVQDLLDQEKGLKAMHAEFSSTGNWDRDTNTLLVHGYYQLMTRFRWFQTEAQRVVPTAGPASAEKSGSTPGKAEPSPVVPKGPIRYKSNWLYVLVCWYKNMDPRHDQSDMSGRWWQTFDWFAAIALLVAPFIPALLAYPFTYYYIGLVAWGYYTWVFKYWLFIHWSEKWTVLWPTYYISHLLAFGGFFGVAVSHALFAQAIPSLVDYAEQYTRR